MRHGIVVDRDEILDQLEKTLHAAVRGEGGCVVLEGPAGIGKSHVLAAVERKARSLMISVVSARSAMLDRAAPLNSLITPLRQSGLLKPDTPVLDTHGANRLHTVNVLGDVLERSSLRAPLLIKLDDAQWADELTALALHILVPRLATLPVLWVLARRPGTATVPAQEVIDSLLRDGARLIQLGPMPKQAVADFCAALLGTRPDATLLRLADRCGGNPFLIEQLLSCLQETNRLVVASGTASVLGGPLPSTFVTTVGERILGQPPEARRLLEAGSIFHRPFSVHEAASLLNRPVAELVPVVASTIGADILTESGSDLAFRNELIREAVYDSLSAPVRAALHREAAAVVQDERRSAIETVEHIIRSGSLASDGPGLEVAREAAAQTAAEAPATAADLILRVLDLLDEQDTARPELISDAVGLLAAAGRVTEAREIGEEAVRAGLDPTTEASLVLGLSEALKHAGQNDAVVEHTGRALARAGVPDPIRAQLLALQAHGLLFTSGAADADRVAAQAVVLAEREGVHAAVVFGLAARSAAARMTGCLADALRIARQAVAVADDAGGTARHRHPGLWLGRALTAMDQFEDAEAIYTSGQREADQLGTAWSQPLWHCYRAELKLAAGKLDDAEAETEVGLRVARQLQALQLSVPLTAIRSQIALRHGELGLAQRLIGEARGLIVQGVSVGPADLAWTQALLEEASGNPKAALGTLAGTLDRMRAESLLLSEDAGAAATMTRLALDAGAPEIAELVAAAAQRLADLNPGVASFAGSAAHATGLVSGDPDALHTAVRHYRLSPRPLARASALEDAAAAERMAGERWRAVGLLDEALATYLSCGVSRDAERVHKRLRGLGVRRSRPRAPRSPGGWSNLTEAELRVVQMVASGLTNREIAGRLYLSPHTVDSHLRHVFTKLSVHNRVELTRLYATWRERDGAPDTGGTGADPDLDDRGVRRLPALKRTTKSRDALAARRAAH